MCVSGEWLVVTYSLNFSRGAIRLYRLPDLTLIQDLNYSMVYPPRCSSAGRVYVPSLCTVSELEITEQGNLSVARNITPYSDWELVTAVALGPQAGQLCIGTMHVSLLGQIKAVVYIISLDNGHINGTLTVPSQIECLPASISALSTGQILVTYTSLQVFTDNYVVIVLYQAISHQPLTISNGTDSIVVLSVAHRENFLVNSPVRSGIDVLDKQGRVVHTVEYAYGIMSGALDLAVWQDTLLVLGYNGDLLWLSPV